MTQDPPASDDVPALRERAKELRCMYEVSSALARREQPPQEVFRRVVDALPPAWQFPEDATARIEYFGRTHARPDFEETPWRQRASISIWRTPVGAVEVVYKREKPTAFEGPFLKEERRLLDDVAQRVGEYLEWKQRELGGERLGGAPEHWRWRQRFAERIAAALDPARFGVRAVYLFGSTEMGSAGAGSDIDLLVAFCGDAAQERDLRHWLEGWSLCLAEVGLQLYGLPSRGLLDARFVSPERAEAEIKAKVASGSMFRELPLGTGTG
jgi:hypothetical protein